MNEPAYGCKKGTTDATVACSERWGLHVSSSSFTAEGFRRSRGGARYRLSLMIGGLWRAVACGLDAALRVDGPACGMHFGAWNDLLFDESYELEVLSRCTSVLFTSYGDV